MRTEIANRPIYGEGGLDTAATLVPSAPDATLMQHHAPPGYATASPRFILGAPSISMEHPRGVYVTLSAVQGRPAGGRHPDNHPLHGRTGAAAAAARNPGT